MARYRVLVREFKWNGQMLGPGDYIESENTQEIITNCVLGRLVPDKGGEQATAAPPVETTTGELARETDSPPAPTAAPMTTEDMPTTPTRRRYVRRDTPNGE